MADFFKFIYEVFKNLGTKKRWLVLILLVFALVFAGSGGRYVNYGGEPNWREDEDQKGIRIESDISLKGGEIKICPQIVVKCNEIIFLIINVKGVYSANTVQLQNKEGKSFFQCEYSSDSKKKLENFQNLIYKMIKEEGERLSIQQVSSCECELEWVAEVSYQNLKRNRGRTRWLLYSSGMIKSISDQEMSYRDSKYYVDLKEFEENEDVEQNRKIIDWICERLKEIKKEA